MYPTRLTPELKLLRKEYVLIQAWKKTAAHIRQRSWTVDTLALDHASVNLPSFIGEIRERLGTSDFWQNEPLRLVPAPKSQEWQVKKERWKPKRKPNIAKRIRPLAHVSLGDQVVATALMLCLADRVETQQGDSRWPTNCPNYREKVISYGNRLFCEERGGKLRHRWGSTKLYRAYYQDYRTYLSRPEIVATPLLKAKRKLVLVNADLKQFYDRVSPCLLIKSLDRMRHKSDDEDFYSLAESVLNWEWDSRDKKEVSAYEKQSEMEDFSRVALPQGLVAAGFFANVVLHALDNALRTQFECNIHEGVRVVDACRYVDDFQILLEITTNEDFSRKQIQKIVSLWLQPILKNNTPGLLLSDDEKKTNVVFFDEEKQPLVRQRAKMNRIQAVISGGHDLTESIEAINASSGLLRAQLMLDKPDKKDWQYSPVPDVRDETVARFSASKFLNTYRALRPRLDIERSTTYQRIKDYELKDQVKQEYFPTRSELDEDAKVFALVLIKQWMKNPSNVRVLIVGLDLWPDVKILSDIFNGLRKCVESNVLRRKKAAKQVAWYCLAEILRAGATSTGFVEDTDALPSNLDLLHYRRRLCKEALYLLNTPGLKIPWYLRQQALLVLITFDPTSASSMHGSDEPEIENYIDLIRFFRGEQDSFSPTEFATLAVLSRRSLLNRERTEALVIPSITAKNLPRIASRDPLFCYELLEHMDPTFDIRRLPNRIKADLCLHPATNSRTTLADVVLKDGDPIKPLRNEVSLLLFARQFLEKWNKLDAPPRVITPGQVVIELDENHEFKKVLELVERKDSPRTKRSIYSVPSWSSPKERWRLQLGFLLRFILAGTRDFTRPVRKTSWKEEACCYRPAESHWYQRIHGMYTAQPVFGDDWLPITEWVEGFLLALLRWPGCQVPIGFKWITCGVGVSQRRIDQRIKELTEWHGKASNLRMLPLKINNPARKKDDSTSLRVCVVQTAMPTTCHLSNKSDLTLNEKTIRRTHRNHLTAILSAINRVGELREPHHGQSKYLDWLILPELAVHPKDISTHLIPFARANKTVVLAGLTYEKLFPNQPLVNSALWIIPENSQDYGLQIRTRRQGKQHLAPNELIIDWEGNQLVQGFRPCQWLIGYPWSSSTSEDPIWLTAAVCYDATDLALVADLRNQSDVLAIPAFNKDVNTFDQMALALHYHMFQLIIVANNGEYGGSNAYWPRRDSYDRQIFHFHGQSQANIFFFEIDNIKEFTKRREGLLDSREKKHSIRTDRSSSDWKYPPAGLKKKS